jgi:cell division protein ZapA (FtsZ GTPase activity inhibitor)
MLNKKNIFLIFILALFLTACQADLEKLQEKTEKIREQKDPVKQTIEETIGENKKDPEDMSLDELEDELEEIEGLEIEGDLGEIEEELK